MLPASFVASPAAWSSVNQPCLFPLCFCHSCELWVFICIWPWPGCMATRDSKKQASPETLEWEFFGWGEERLGPGLCGANKSAPTPGFFPGEPEASVKAVVEPPCHLCFTDWLWKCLGLLPQRSKVHSLLPCRHPLQLPSWVKCPNAAIHLPPPAECCRDFLPFKQHSLSLLLASLLMFPGHPCHHLFHCQLTSL